MRLSQLIELEIVFSPTVLCYTGHKMIIPGFSAENDISVTYKGEKGCLKWEDNSLTLLLDDSDSPSEAGECSINVSAGERGAFRYPNKGYVKPASKFFYIKCPKHLKTPVTIRIKHDVAKEDIEHLRFITCSDDQPPYDFNILENGDFTSTYGEISIKKPSHSFYSIVQLLITHRVKGILSIMEKSIGASLYCSLQSKLESSGYYSWNIYVSAVKNCLIFRKYKQKSIEDEYKDDLQLIAKEVVEFTQKEASVTVSTQCEPDMRENGRIEAAGSSSIRKIDIIRFVDGCPPHIKFVLLVNHKLCGSALKVTFTLHGFQEPINFKWHLSIPQSKIKEVKYENLS